MDRQNPYTTSDAERARRRALRAAQRRRRQRARRAQALRRALPLLVIGIAVIFLGAAIVRAASVGGREEPAPDDAKQTASLASASRHIPDDTMPVWEPEPVKPFSAAASGGTVRLTDQIVSTYAVLIDVDEKTILAEKNADTVISPASMTKILTLLVAVEHIDDLDDTFTVTREITDYTYSNGCSVMGLMVGEEAPLRDLLYGTILPSGADAALCLAYYTAGSHEAFVDLMNEKVEELGLSDTARFDNCVGIYNENNVCTVYDMAVILKTAMDNDICREVLSRHTYSYPANDFHPDGVSLSNLFLRRIEDHVDPGIEVVGAKTGYVSQAGNCAASFAQNSDGKSYICVTAKASSTDRSGSWNAIFDHAALYGMYAKPSGN